MTKDMCGLFLFFCLFVMNFYVINTEDQFNLDLLFIAFTEHREIRGILKTNVRHQMFI